MSISSEVMIRDIRDLAGRYREHLPFCQRKMWCGYGTLFRYCIEDAIQPSGRRSGLLPVLPIPNLSTAVFSHFSGCLNVKHVKAQYFGCTPELGQIAGRQRTPYRCKVGSRTKDWTERDHVRSCFGGCGLGEKGTLLSPSPSLCVSWLARKSSPPLRGGKCNSLEQVICTSTGTR